MTTFDLADAAGRAGMSLDGLNRLVELGIVSPDEGGRFSAGDVRRAGMVGSFANAGIPLDGLADAIRRGHVSLAFLDAPAYERFSAFSDVTFAQFAERANVPVDVLMLIREASGSPTPRPDDLLREEELPQAKLIELAMNAGFRSPPLHQMMRVQADGLRRMAETESAMWQTEVIEPAMAAGKRPDEILGDPFGDKMSAATERAVIGMYHLQQGQAWGTNIIEGLESMLAAAGLHTRVDHPPAMCFLDITGYTRLTQEQGDVAAAELADRLGPLIQRTSIKHGGRPVKWLGDGVMLYFPNPGHGVLAALEMVAGVAEADLPQAHVGLHAGPVIFQEGDYYGATVNTAARIADYARAGEVLVSQQVVDASAESDDVDYRDIGQVELKGLADPMRLHSATARA